MGLLGIKRGREERLCAGADGVCDGDGRGASFDLPGFGHFGGIAHGSNILRLIEVLNVDGNGGGDD